MIENAINRIMHKKDQSKIVLETVRQFLFLVKKCFLISKTKDKIILHGLSKTAK
jgi:hypothetical protein